MPDSEVEPAPYESTDDLPTPVAPDGLGRQK
jgi:hypothetical protein